MEIKRLQHCSLVVRDVERSRRFYGTVLGMEEIPRPSNFTFGGAWLQASGYEIHLIAAQDTTAPPGLQDPGPAKRTGLATHLAFEVHDLEAARRHLEHQGVEILGGPMPRGDGVMQMYLHDPDHYLIELFQWSEEAPREAAERGRLERAASPS